MSAVNGAALRGAGEDARFWAKVRRAEPDECWEWTAHRNEDGYGTFVLNGRAGKTVKAHRFAYESLIAAIPDDLVIDHLCQNTGCVNPWHMEPATNRENILRSQGPAALNAAKTHCVHGHSLTGDNVAPRADGGRRCLTCRRATDRKRKALRKLRRRESAV